MNLPNKLSIIRILMIPLMIAIFYIRAIPYNYTICAGIFALASLTDFLDGYIARKYNLVTDLGKFLDPIADKVLVLCALIVMLTENAILGGPISTLNLGGFDSMLFGKIIGGVGVSIIVAREMIVSVLRMMAAAKGKVLAAEKIGKIKTFTTDFAIIILLVAVDVIDLYYAGLALFVISVLLTLYSGIVYVVKNREVFK